MTNLISLISLIFPNFPSFLLPYFLPGKRMKIKLLPSSFDEKGAASPEQHLTCYLVDDRVALDAGSLSLTFGQGHRRLVHQKLVRWWLRWCSL